MMSIAIDYIVKKNSNSITYYNHSNNLSSNRLRSNVNINNIKKDLFFLKNKTLIKQEIDDSFNTVFTNYLSDFILNDSMLLFDKVKKK